MNDPYNQMLSIIREEAGGLKESPFFIGEIVSPLPDIKVKVSDLILDKSDIQIDKWLLDRATETIEHIKNTLDIGDSVVMLRNNNAFIIISKVVDI